MKFGCLGPKTNSVIAAQKCASSIDELVMYSRMELVFQALKDKKVDRILIPIRNSITGEITRYSSLINGYETIKEFAIPINHNLGCANGNHSIIKSHPEVLKQCKNYLDLNYPESERESTTSTESAAKIVSETKKGIAIANLDTCLHYGLKILDKDIVENNYSTFVLLKNV
ncbi:prephenate dehydratase domain-containing protein [Nanoarchaeota archaeon]